MNRILEAFTRPHDQVTAIDEIIQFIVAAPLIVLVLILISGFLIWMNKRS